MIPYTAVELLTLQPTDVTIPRTVRKFIFGFTLWRLHKQWVQHYFQYSDGWPRVNGYAGTAAARTISRIPVLFRDQRNRAKYEYTRLTMVVKRCGFYAIRHARPDRSFPPLPRVGPQRRRQRMA